MTVSAQVSFTVTRFRPGYDMAQVNAFLAGIADRTVQELNDVMFKTTRFGQGYDESEVDEYLDACIARLQASPPSA